MIPTQNIVAWSKVAPWAEPRQVEQDLIIARALVELFGDPLLRDELRFRGGTALNKLHFPKPLRYSEDIDLTRTKDGPSKPIWDRVHDLLNSWLGEPEYFRSRVAPALRYTVAAEDGSSTIRLKIETNEVEIAPFDAPQTLPFKVDNPWFSGSADIPTFSKEEVLSTKLRALLQRNKGRDLVDLAHALDVFPKLDVQRTVDMFGEYVKQKPIPRWEAEKRMFEKLERRGFLADVQPLLAADERARFDDVAGRRAFARVFETVIGKIPGKAWATTPELLKKYGFEDG
ncbi:MAG: nucleotidyl transferase AbiEii/AbiGii toxin family protein [Alphaproteobacteria bacterium]|nr:nucleotidyl transferase AbiEii/AbiGii toxin family protein [Alphaproteobacteria bacterium]MBL6938194.1 nucleotidyl transferase AbiEii/AbiGii toxin family protein [Alphaproteobacteria bacterium]MBL7097250.1 nucleotidyl transferase AbiEii/AbiGii toxin family protein [Alphaproteobacteria bacterium]